MDERALIEKLTAIHRLRMGATTPGEARAASAAYARVYERLQRARAERPVDYQISLPDPWARKLFYALLRKHDLRPYRRPRQRRTTVRVRVAKGLMDEVLWPEFQELRATLYDYLESVTDRVVSQALQADTSEPTEEAQPALTG